MVRLNFVGTLDGEVQRKVITGAVKTETIVSRILGVGFLGRMPRKTFAAKKARPSNDERKAATEPLRLYLEEQLARLGIARRSVADQLEVSDTVFADLMSGRRNFQSEHIAKLLSLFSQRARERTQSGVIAGRPSGLTDWTRSDSYRLLWLFVHGRHPEMGEADVKDIDLVRREFTLGGHKQPAVIYEFVPEGYERKLIASSFDRGPLRLPADPKLAARFDEIHAIETQRLETSRDFNGSGLTLTYIQSTRSGPTERAHLTLRFKPSDYLRRRTTRALFHELGGAQKDAVLDTIPDGVQEAYCGGFGAVISIVTADNRLLFFQRSGTVGGDQALFDCTVTESANAELDKDEFGHPSPYRTAIRGLAEEAALSGLQDEVESRLKLYAVLCRKEYYEWAMYGTLDLSGTDITSERLARNVFKAAGQQEHTSEVLTTTFALARDSFEFQRYVAVRFTLSDVVRFIATHHMTEYGFVNAVMTLRSVLNVSASAIASELMLYPALPPLKAH